jgi:predicted metal-dependent HD superfamily phosphohydrolase
MYADTYNEKKFSTWRYDVLKWFVDKDKTLFHTEYFRSKYQEQAEKNIANEISTLPKK